MLSDRKASELITKSLRRELTPDEAKEVDEHLDESPESVAFARLSRAIQNSVSDVATLTGGSDQTIGDGLSDDARQRLKDSINQVQSASQPADQPPSNDLTSERLEPTAGSRQSRAGYPISEVPADARRGSSRFSIIRQLGEGGLGNVWLARDEWLKRNVAIKELNRDALESEKSWRRFQREAEITGHLEHPNIVPLYQFSVDRDSGELFYAMRFVGKRTLADAIIEHHDRIRSGGDYDDVLALHRLLSVFLDVCQAIAYAHSRGVIHRDLKPENVALDAFGQVIVLDWGLAKVVEDGELVAHLNQETNIADAALAQTIDGEVIGTPLYMAPEQASGDMDQVDKRTDVYGLGAILFSILTGCAPHEDSSDRAKSNINEVLKAIAENQSPVPRDHADSVPRELEAICVKAMEHKSYLRHESVSELADAVERWMAGQSQKQGRYDNLRMEGRELRADLQSSVRDLETNARFMSRLPPIQELIAANSEEEIAVWRERLTTIYKGLLSANSDYSSVVFSKIAGEEFTEIVRVERHSTDHSNIRSVPRSRLRTGSINEYLSAVTQQKPEEVLTALVCDPLCNKSTGCFDDNKVHLVAAVPVYDDASEDLYGVVMIDCDIDRLMRRQMNKRSTASDIVIACDIHHTMMRSQSGQIIEESISRPVAEIAPHFSKAVDILQNHLEYIDETDAEIYGARLWLIPNKHGLMYLLRRERE